MKPLWETIGLDRGLVYFDRRQTFVDFKKVEDVRKIREDTQSIGGRRERHAKIAQRCH